MSRPPLTLATLHDGYLAGSLTPRRVVEGLLAATGDERHVWITRLSHAEVVRYIDALDPQDVPDAALVAAKPLYGIPFVIKDNIDLAGVPTTAGCPAYAYTPARSATVVQRLIEAGAIPLGKVNLDQFATGLVGARSPYGACRNSFDSDFISGGSSSGSAVAVAQGLAAFSLGTDTAGSGRVPAAFNNIVGLKPGPGCLSTRGVVPACRSLDCVSIFALTSDDARAVFDVAKGFDPADPYSRTVTPADCGALRVGFPPRRQLEFFGDAEYARLYEQALADLHVVGATLVEVDFEPFFDAGRLLYEGPWVAERYAAVGEFIDSHAAEVHPVTRSIIAPGKTLSAVAMFRAQYALMEYARRAEAVWTRVDLLCTPTAGTVYRLADVEKDPLRLNSNLGFYTNFMNMLNLCGVAVPAGRRGDGLPFGVTLIGPTGAEHALLSLGDRLHRVRAATLGALGHALPPPEPPSPRISRSHSPFENDSTMTIAVCGAHMRGLALNEQLTALGARFLLATCTATRYRLFALPGGPPYRPGLLRVDENGAAIELELWTMPRPTVGEFIATIPAPLGIGKIELQDGTTASGFLCEAYACDGAVDITHFGGWRGYLSGLGLGKARH